LNTVDATSGKTLVTTRIKNLVESSGQVEVGLPDIQSSIKLLLSAAGVEHLDTVPREAEDIVQLCGCLPLAVDIAGKFIRDLGVTPDDWIEVPAILKHELRNAGSSESNVSVEERLVTASLGSVPARDRDSVTALFQVFANIEEDTYVPLAPLALMLAAVTGGEIAPSELELRRLLQILISRSLVLGTWERPQLHDIVRDLAISMFTADELARRHARIVDAFGAARPPHPAKFAGGLPAWNGQNTTAQIHACALYIEGYIRGHLNGVMCSALDDREEIAVRWATYVPGADISSEVRYVIEQSRFLPIAEKLQQDGRLFEMHCILGMYLMSRFTKEGLGDWFKEEAIYERSWATYSILDQLTAGGKPAFLSQAQFDLAEINSRWWDFQIQAFKKLGGAEQLGGRQMSVDELAQAKERLMHLLETTKVGQMRDDVRSELETEPLLQMGDIDSADPLILTRLNKNVNDLVGGETDEELGLQSMAFNNLLISGFGDLGASDIPRLLRLQSWSWNDWGGDSLPGLILQYFDGWSIGNFDEERSSSHSIEPWRWGVAASPMPFVVALRGDVPGANRCIDKLVYVLRRTASSSAPTVPENMDFLEATRHLVPVLIRLGRSRDAVELQELFGLTWSAADSWLDGLYPNLVPGTYRQRGSDEYGGCAGSIEAVG
jgi:hypothetical protein